MGNLIIKTILAYAVGAMLGACAALLAIEYDWNMGVTLIVAMLLTVLVDFTILRVEF